MSLDQDPAQRTRVHAFGDDALGDLDAVGVAEAISTGRVSAREAAEAAFARADRVDPVLHAIVLRDTDRALTQADHPTRGAFSGVPTFVKDNTDVAGLPTLQGSLAVPPVPAAHDAEFTEQLKSTGLVVLGKTTMPEFGWSASTEFATLPPTRNPWHPDYSSGASSGGAAALVASGVVPIAHGNDGGGSIRIPAAACGLVGLKVTRGRLAPPAEAKEMPVDVVSNGVLSRTVRDTAHFLAAAEHHRLAPDLPRLDLVEGPSDRSMRIGVVEDSVIGVPTDRETRAAVRSTASLLASMGHELVEVDPPVDQGFADAFVHYWSLLAFSMHRFGRRLVHPDFDPSRTDPLTQHLSRRFARHFWRTPGSIVALRRSAGRYRRAFAEDQLDAVLSPVLTHTTPRLGYLSPAGPFPQMLDRLVRYAAFTPLNNASGSPAISVPAGLSRDGLPIGVHLMARHGDERTLLELAYALEAERPFPRITDPVPTT